MSARTIVGRYTDKLVRAKHPIDVVAENPLDNSGDGATCAFKVYDISKDEIISATEAIGQDTLSVTNAGRLEVDDLVEVTQNDASLHESTINAVDSAAGTITIDDVLIVAAAVGNRVRVVMGVAVPMSEYGTPDINALDWGFSGLLPDTHVAHLDPRSKAGFDVDIEVDFNGGAGLRKVKTLCTTIQEDNCA